MMIEREESIDGIQYAVHEIDQELTSLIPRMRTNYYRGEVLRQIDELLDQRNDLTSILGELMIDEYERLMTE
jgi:hypothetical protein